MCVIQSKIYIHQLFSSEAFLRISNSQCQGLEMIYLLLKIVCKNCLMVAYKIIDVDLSEERILAR